MKLYISTAAINKVTVSNSVKGSALAGRRIWSFRALVLLVFVLGILLPFLFVRAAFLLLESSPFCSSSIGNFIKLSSISSCNRFSVKTTEHKD